MNEPLGKHVGLSFFSETTQNPNLTSVFTARNHLPTQATLLSMYEYTPESNLTPVTTARRPSDSSATYSNTTGATQDGFSFQLCFFIYVFCSFFFICVCTCFIMQLSFPLISYLLTFCACSGSTQETGHTNVHILVVRSLSLSFLTYR